MLSVLQEATAAFNRSETDDDVEYITDIVSGAATLCSKSLASYNRSLTANGSPEKSVDNHSRPAASLLEGVEERLRGASDRLSRLRLNPVTRKRESG